MADERPRCLSPLVQASLQKGASHLRKTLQVREQSFLDAAGRILQNYVDGRRSGHALHLVERWANALYWVGEARRETYDFMAIEDYGCAASGLSGAARSAKDKTAFAVTALKPEGATAHADALTVNAAVHKVY